MTQVPMAKKGSSEINKKAKRHGGHGVKMKEEGMVTKVQTRLCWVMILYITVCHVLLHSCCFSPCYRFLTIPIFLQIADLALPSPFHLFSPFASNCVNICSRRRRKEPVSSAATHADQSPTGVCLCDRRARPARGPALSETRSVTLNLWGL